MGKHIKEATINEVNAKGATVLKSFFTARVEALRRGIQISMEHLDTKARIYGDAKGV